jgi:hypothetical protein
MAHYEAGGCRKSGRISTGDANIQIIDRFAREKAH